MRLAGTAATELIQVDLLLWEDLCTLHDFTFQYQMFFYITEFLPRESEWHAKHSEVLEKSPEQPGTSNWEKRDISVLLRAMRSIQASLDMPDYADMPIS